MNSKTESVPSELTFSAIETGEGSEELLRSIKQILTEGDSHNAAAFNKQYWEWQYKNLPSGRSVVYMCRLGNEIAGYYHAPFYSGQVKGKEKLFAMVQDVAVNNEVRGKGVFKKLADYATNRLVSSRCKLYLYVSQR
jgi:hypothetical protein